MPADSVIKLRRGTAAAWTSANPVLDLGEPGVETDTGREKRGDGSTVWNSLPYVSHGPVADLRSYRRSGDVGWDAAFTRAFADSVVTLLMPPSLTPYDVAGTVTLPIGMNLEGYGATLRATSAIAGPVLRTEKRSTVGQWWRDKVIRGLTIDCNGLADTGLDVPYALNSSVIDVTVKESAGHAILLGDTTAPGPTNELKLRGVKVDRSTSGAVPASSFGIWLRNAYDSSLTQCTVVGSNTSFRIDKTDTKLVDCHGWGWGGRLPVTIFDDAGFDNTYVGCCADTPSAYGFRIRQYNATILGGFVFNNTAGGDNVMEGVYFDQSSPLSTVIGVQFVGADSSHRIAKDIALTDFTTCSVLGCFSSNVQTVNATTSRFTALATRDLTLTDKGTLPAASSTLRGQHALIQGASGAHDVEYVCVKNQADGYEWLALAPALDVRRDQTISNFTDPFGGNRVWDAANRCHAWRVTAGGSVSKARIKVAVQSGNISIAVHRNTGSGVTAAPGAQLATTGAVACPAVGDAEISLGGTVAVSPGDWVLMSCDNATASFLGGGVAGINVSSLFAGRGGYISSGAHPVPSSPTLTGYGLPGGALIRLVP